MVFCTAFGCKNQSTTGGPDITFHCFPKEKVFRKSWLLAGRLRKRNLTDDSVLCSEHFTENQFDRASQCGVRLRDHAIPSVFKFKDFPPKNGINALKPKKVLASCIVKTDAVSWDLRNLSSFFESCFAYIRKVKESADQETTKSSITSLDTSIQTTAIAINKESASLSFPQVSCTSTESFDSLKTANNMDTNEEQELPSLPQVNLSSVAPLGSQSRGCQRKFIVRKKNRKNPRKQLRRSNRKIAAINAEIRNIKDTIYLAEFIAEHLTEQLLNDSEMS